MAWNLHIVGEHLETDLEDLMAKLVTDLEALDHRVTSATLTTDAGQKSLPTAPPPSEPAQTIGGEPVVPTDVVPSTSTVSDSEPLVEVPTDTPPSLADAPIAS